MKDFEGLGFLGTNLDAKIRAEFLPWLINSSYNEINEKQKKLIENFEFLLKEIQVNLLNEHRKSFMKRQNDLKENESKINDEKQVKFINFGIKLIKN